jgi:hypothetical protein
VRAVVLRNIVCVTNEGRKYTAGGSKMKSMDFQKLVDSFSYFTFNGKLNYAESPTMYAVQA